MAAKLFGDLGPHRRCDAAAHVQLVVGVPDLRILLDRLQQLGAIYERILLGHGHTGGGVTGKGTTRGREGGTGAATGSRVDSKRQRDSAGGAQLRPLTSIIGE